MAFTPACMLHGVLEHFDLPDLMRLFQGRDVRSAKNRSNRACSPPALPVW